MKFEAPPGFEELDHPEHVAISVAGGSEEEVYARAALGVGLLLAGGGPMTQSVVRILEPAGHDRLSQLVALARDVLAAFFDERLILAEIDVHLGPPFSAVGRFAHWDPALHQGGLDLQVVSYDGASFEPDGNGWRARLVLAVRGR
jgi:archease protein family (MTH1598/TM1083)